MPNRQIQDQQQRGNRSPGAFSPDDDEARQNDATTAADQDENLERDGGTRRAQQNFPTEPADKPADEDLRDDVDSDEDDIWEDDDDEEDEEGSGAGQP